jgi:hypothetical protein
MELNVTRNIIALTAALALIAGFAGPAAAEDLQIVNKSKSEIHHLYVSAAASKKWGDDQLGDETIDPGDIFTLHKIPTGVYDLKLVDEDDTECVVTNVNFDESKVWTVTQKVLSSCE